MRAARTRKVPIGFVLFEKTLTFVQLFRNAGKVMPHLFFKF